MLYFIFSVLSIKNIRLSPSLLRFSFLLKNKLVARKEGRCAGKASAGKDIHSEVLPCFRIMWRAHRAPSRSPLHRNTPFLRGRTACPPGPRKRGVPHGFSAQRPCFRAWQCLKFNRSQVDLANSECGQENIRLRRDRLIINGLAGQKGNGEAYRSFDLGKDSSFQVSSPLAQGKGRRGNDNQVRGRVLS